MPSPCPHCLAYPSRFGVTEHGLGCPLACDFPVFGDDARMYRQIGA